MNTKPSILDRPLAGPLLDSHAELMLQAIREFLKSPDDAYISVCVHFGDDSANFERLTGEKQPDFNFNFGYSYKTVVYSVGRGHLTLLARATSCEIANELRQRAAQLETSHYHD